jgi:alkylglycerol monooxygenase
MAALVASLAGDVFLMLPGAYFIPGLASFLVAHLFYISLFRQGVPWFPSRRALLSTLGVGAATAVAWGACVFMLSDSLIAVNRFVQPLPLVSLWVLTSYYAAQILIVHNARPVVPAVPTTLA